MAREMRRINTNMPVELIDRLDEYANSLYLSRSAAINVLVLQGLDNQKVLGTMDELLKAIKLGEMDRG